MASQFTWILLVTLLGSASATASPCDQQRGDEKKSQDSRPSDPPRMKWWLHPESRKELSLSDQQVKQIDSIFEAAAPKQRERWHEIEQLDKALDRTIKEFSADAAVVAQQVEKIEKLRAEVNATRTIMIYKMYLVLTPEQRVKVDAIRARLDQERRRQDEERKRQGKSDKHVSFGGIS
jgi:Spy/CpxP family protein refolding chaperone